MPQVQAAIYAFAARLDRSDPILIAFNMTPMAMVVSDPTLPDNPVIYVNKGFEDLTGFAAVEVLGRNCRFMQGPLTDEADVAKLREAIEKRERIEIDLLNHRRDGTPFWNRLMVAPVFDHAGALKHFVASQFDVTVERHQVVELEKDRLALAAEVAQRDADLVENNAKLRMALKAGGLGTWTLDLPEQQLTASPSCKQNFGRPANQPFTYDKMLASIHPDDAPRMREAVRETLENGTPYNIEYRILTPGGEQRWVAVQGELQFRADGTILAMSGFSTDISDRKFAEEHRTILAQELNHRVKNTLATVNAVVSQTLRDADTLDDAALSVAGRIASMATAHELLIQDEIEGANIGDIVRRVLGPFIDKGGNRFTIEGPDIRLSPEVTLALSMALYELATNAVKYGALSVQSGHVAVVWSLEGNDGTRRLRFSWTEQGGPKVSAPTRTGFGSRMIERVLRSHVRGTTVVDYRPEGLVFQVEAAI